MYTTTEEAWGFASRAASKYSEDLSLHTTRGIHKRQREGLPFGCVPQGYAVKRTIVNNQVIAERVIDPEGARTVETIFSMIEAGQMWGPIARELNARGLRTNRGNPWTPPVVRDLAKSRLYLGEQGYPPLIERDRWERIQSIIEATTPVGNWRRAGGRPVEADRFLLRGLAFCLKCGAPIHVRSDRGGYYGCRNKRRGTGLCDARAIPAQLVDELVLTHLDTFIDRVADWIAERVAENEGELAAYEHALKREQAALTDLERLRAKLLLEYERHVDEGRPTAYLALEAVERKDRDIDAQRRRIETAEALLSEWQAPPDVDAALDYYNAVVDTIRGRISGAQGIRDLNARLSTVIGGIWLAYDGRRVEATYKLRPPGLTDDEAAIRFPAPPRGWPLADEYGGRDLIERVRASVGVGEPATKPRSSPCSGV
jgi:hypothetical protein